MLFISFFCSNLIWINLSCWDFSYIKFILFPHKDFAWKNTCLYKNLLHGVVEFCYALSSVFRAWISSAVLFFFLHACVFVETNLMGVLLHCRTFAWNSLLVLHDKIIWEPGTVAEFEIYNEICWNTFLYLTTSFFFFFLAVGL